MSAFVYEKDLPPLADVQTRRIYTPRHRQRLKGITIITPEIEAARRSKSGEQTTSNAQHTLAALQSSAIQQASATHDGLMGDRDSPSQQEPMSQFTFESEHNMRTPQVSVPQQSREHTHSPATGNDPVSQQKEGEDLETQLGNMIISNRRYSGHPYSQLPAPTSGVHPNDQPLAQSIQSSQHIVSGAVGLANNVPPSSSKTSQFAPNNLPYNAQRQPLSRNPQDHQKLSNTSQLPRGPRSHYSQGFTQQSTAQDASQQFVAHPRKSLYQTQILDLPPLHQDRYASAEWQCMYLQQIAVDEVADAEILPTEKQEREALRSHLEKVCREAIAIHERQWNPEFEPESVVLECFGSLQSGFATRGSDMDLVILSPQSKHDPNFSESQIPRLLEQIFLMSGFGARLLTRTRVPIIRACQKPSPELLDTLVAGRISSDTLQGSASKTSGSIVRKDSEGYTNDELVRLYTIAMDEGWFNEAERRLINKFIEDYKHSQSHTLNEQLVASKLALKGLPNVLSRYRELPEEKVEIPKTGVGILWDLNFSNHLARHNTKLLRCYQFCDTRIRSMVLFVKAWAKKRDINCAYKGTLCSYGYVLMVLHYAVNIASPPLAPNLQHELSRTRGGSPNTPRECQGHNVQFWCNENSIKHSAMRGEISYNRESLGSLLRGFFQYFAEFGRHHGIHFGPFHWQNDVMSLRTLGGILPKQEKGWTESRTDTVPGLTILDKPIEVKQRYLLSIEDPFELDHNVARPVTWEGLNAIRNEFRRANRIIKNAGTIGNVSYSLLEETKQEQLERKRTYFGPHPKPSGDRQPSRAQSKRDSHQATPSRDNKPTTPNSRMRGRMNRAGEVVSDEVNDRKDGGGLQK